MASKCFVYVVPQKTPSLPMCVCSLFKLQTEIQMLICCHRSHDSQWSRINWKLNNRFKMKIVYVSIPTIICRHFNFHFDFNWLNSTYLIAITFLQIREWSMVPFSMQISICQFISINIVMKFQWDFLESLQSKFATPNFNSHVVSIFRTRIDVLAKSKFDF